MKNKIAILKIVNTNGIRGALKCIHFCDSVYELENYDTFYTKDKTPLDVEKMTFQRDVAIIKFKQINNANDGLLYKNEILYIEKTSLPKLDDGVYYISDLMGLNVKTLEEDKNLGTIIDVLKTGANDVYVVKRHDDEKKQYLIPAIKEVIHSVDIKAGDMIITPIAGLLDDED